MFKYKELWHNSKIRRQISAMRNYCSMEEVYSLFVICNDVIFIIKAYIFTQYHKNERPNENVK